MLGALLGKVVVGDRPNGHELFLLIRELRRQIQASRAAGQDTTQSDVENILSNLLASESTKADLEKLLKIVDTFRIFLELASIAESYHHDQFQPPEPSIEQLIAQKALGGVPSDNILLALEKICLRLVSTAHPTQIFRTTYLHHHKIILKLLGEFHDAKNAEDQARVIKALEARIQCLWLTGFVKWVKPTVQDEAKALENYLDVLFNTLPELQVTLESTLQTTLRTQRRLFKNHPAVEIGSWVGGDMDGNPNAQPHVLAAILASRRQQILIKYRDQLAALAEEYSFSALKGIERHEALLSSIEQDLKEFEAAKSHPFERSEGIYKYHEREPYRQKLLLMVAKLNHTLTYPLTLSMLDAPRFSSQFSFLPQPFPHGFAYRRAAELISDLKLILDGLNELGLSDNFLRPIETCLNAVQIFDFHFAGIDLREEAEHFQSAARCGLMARGYDLAPFFNPNDNTHATDAWFAFLEQYLTQATTTHIQPHELARVVTHWPQWFSEGGASEMRLFGMTAVMKLAHAEIGPQASRHVLLSMTHSASDALAALALLKWQQLAHYENDQWMGAVDIVPLFETINDLVAAPQMMTQLFESAAYRGYLRARGNRQVVLIAYSDSNKDGGILPVNGRSIWYNSNCPTLRIDMASPFSITMGAAVVLVEAADRPDNIFYLFPPKVFGPAFRLPSKAKYWPGIIYRK
ncbi:MAG: phosphoenolpyruvate carboxylase [Vampirovibrionales bacterium]|nr:phosphoenolpyruvate carboxylase [Vampirovibrionales bacterium]